MAYTAQQLTSRSPVHPGFTQTTRHSVLSPRPNSLHFDTRRDNLQMRRRQDQQLTLRVEAVKTTEAPAAKGEPLPLIGTEPKRFSVSQGQLLNILSAAFPGMVRLFSGAVVSGYGTKLKQADASGKTYAVATVAGRQVMETSELILTFKRPAQPIVFYEFEACPFCRKVREAVCILDLDVLYYPCPAGGPTWRPTAPKQGDRPKFPYMVDPNTGVQMPESDDIIRYLFTTYGDGKVPLLLRLGPLTAIGAALGMLPRITRGARYKGSRQPEQPLVYWGYEPSPFCKVVKEVLCELELPHVQRSAARGSPKRQELFELRGHFQVPYLEDPNTGVAMFESAQIMQYLQDTYGQPIDTQA